MKLKRLRFGVGAVVVAASAFVAQPAHAAPNPWYVAGDSNGALGQCDPALLGRSGNEGAWWSSHTVFTPTPPCRSGGQINALAVGPTGRVFSAGYQYAANGHKQGVAGFSDDGGVTWTEIQRIPVSATDTEYRDVEVVAMQMGSPVPVYQVILWAGTEVNSAFHEANGPFQTGWQTLTYPAHPGTQYADMAPLDRRNSTGPMLIAGQRGPCGLVSTFSLTWPTIFEDPSHGSCAPGHDVSLDGVASNPAPISAGGGDAAQSYIRSVAVGTATPREVGPQRPVIVRMLWNSSTPAVTQLLPGSGSLHSVAFRKETQTSPEAWVAVGSKATAGGVVGIAFRSLDRGVTWTSVSLPSGVKKLRKIVHTGSVFLAVGDGGQILKSVDGASWAYVVSPASNSQSLRAVADPTPPIWIP